MVTMEGGRPLPVPDQLAAEFWAFAREGVLMFQRCTRCLQAQHYPRPLCIACGSEAWTWEQASGIGVIHTFTVTLRNDATAFRGRVPYVLAIVDLPEGLRMTGNVLHAEPDSVRIGDSVRLTFEALDEHFHLPQWTMSAPAVSGGR